jgi:hypothetical protein
VTSQGHSRGVICPQCGHKPTLLQVIRINNPIRFNCPSCKAELTLGASGWGILLVAVALAVGFASFAAGRFNSGAWSLLECGLFFAFLLVFVLPVLECLVLRFATATLRQARAA